MSSCDDSNVLDDDGKPAFQYQDNRVDRLPLLDKRFAVLHPSPDPGAGDPIDVGIRQQAEDIEDLAHAGLARAKAASA